MASSLSVKPWKLEDNNEIVFSDFLDWKATLLTALRTQDVYKPFLESKCEWRKVSENILNRGLDDEKPGGVVLRSADKRLADLTLMLEFVSSKVPHYLQADIVEESTSLKSVWVSVRNYYGFSQNEANFLSFFDLTWEPNERPERLFRRLRSHVQDNKLSQGGLLYDGKQLTDDEKISPTVDRLVVGRWMDLLHPHLRGIVIRQFASDLQVKSLKDIQPLISKSIDQLLAEARQLEEKDSQISWVKTKGTKPKLSFGGNTGYRPNNRQFSSGNPSVGNPSIRPNNRQPQSGNSSGTSALPLCAVCLAEGRSFRHDMQFCRYIRPVDRQAVLALCRGIDTASLDSHELEETTTIEPNVSGDSE